MREQRKSMDEGDEHLNPCKTKIFPFLFRSRYSQSQRATENTRNQAQNHNIKSTKLNFNTRENSGFHFFSVESPERSNQRSIAKSTPTGIKHPIANNQKNLARDTQNHQGQQPQIYECCLQKYEQLQVSMKENEDLQKRFSEVQKQLHEEEKKYEQICNRYLEFVGSRNQRNAQKVKQLMEALEEKEKEEKFQQLLKRENLLIQIQKMKISTKSVQTSRRSQERSWRK